MDRIEPSYRIFLNAHDVFNITLAPYWSRIYLECPSGTIRLGAASQANIETYIHRLAACNLPADNPLSIGNLMDPHTEMFVERHELVILVGSSSTVQWYRIPLQQPILIPVELAPDKG